MKEILEIIRKGLSNCFEMGLRQSPTDAENSEFYRPLIDLTLAPKETKEIQSLIDANYYPKEFVEWFVFKALQIHKYQKRILFMYDFKKYAFFSINDVYQFWKDNIQGK